MAQYPTAIKSFTNLVNGVNDVLAAHVNNRQDEIVAIETELGTDVAGNDTDLVTRLNKYGAKAWIIADLSTSDDTILDSYNISGIAEQSTGRVQCTFSTALADADYIVMTGGDGNDYVYTKDNTRAAATFELIASNNSGGTDAAYCCGVVLGD